MPDSICVSGEVGPSIDGLYVSNGGRRAIGALCNDRHASLSSPSLPCATVFFHFRAPSIRRSMIPGDRPLLVTICHVTT